MVQTVSTELGDSLSAYGSSHGLDGLTRRIKSAWVTGRAKSALHLIQATRAAFQLIDCFRTSDAGKIGW